VHFTAFLVAKIFLWDAKLLLYCSLTYFQVDVSALADELLTRVHDEERRSTSKVTVVGTGQVGMAAAFAMMTQVCRNLSTAEITRTELFLFVSGNLFLCIIISDTDDV